MKKLLIVLLGTALVSCGNNKSYDPYRLSPQNDTILTTNDGVFEVDFKTNEYNTKTVHIKLNDAVGKDALFDTGCSGMLISSLEFVDLIKEGAISKNDYLGDSQSSIADGSTITNAVYKIREVSVIDKNGNAHVLHDIAATVVENPGANILVGNSIIDNLATHSYTVDLENNVIRFQ